MRILSFITLALLLTKYSYGVDCFNRDGQSQTFGNESECTTASGYPLTEEQYRRQARAIDNQGGNRDEGTSRRSGSGSRCQDQLDRARDEWRAANALPEDVGTANAKATAINRANTNLARLVDCRALELVAQSYTRDLSTSDVKRTSDGRATCYLKGGYTTDFDSCASTANAYNTIMGMEQILLATQGVRNASNQQNIQARASAQVSTGDGQNAAFDATLADNQFKKNLGREQLMAYTAAVAFLGSKLASWKSGRCGTPGSRGDVSSNRTETNPPAANTADPALNLPVIADCTAAMPKAKSYRGSEVVANDDAKAAFSQAMVGFLAKAAAAKAAMDRLDRNSAVVNAAKNATNTPDGAAVFEKCVITPLDPECIQRSGRTSAAGFTQGDFSAGEGFGNNAFNLGDGASDDMVGDSTDFSADGNGAVADIASPFGDSAREANGILDPAAAAQTSPGGGGGGGGGGVGGGLGGGGGASLGNDLAGEDKDNKAKDIEANKLAGNYGSGGGKGFSAVAGGKEDNPFQNLFDSKSEGGVEEDRSIASDDGGKDSGLFQRISNKMNQVVAEKRIEATNLE